MTLSDFYNEVSRHTDTDKQQIGASDTKRVLAVFFAQLVKLDAADAANIVAKGLEAAKKKAGK